MDIGFVGIGMMGKPMAVNLLKAGHNVTVVNRSQGKVQELAGMGATPGASPAEAARGAEVVGLCLVGDAVVEEVLCGENGVLAGAGPGTVVLDHSTVHPEFARRMEEVCASRGVTYLDAPVSGTGDVAWGGRLTVMAGGDAAAFERARPALDAVSANARRMGPVGSGNMAKLVNNMVKDINQLGVLETFVLGAKQGLDCGLLFHVMRNGASASRQLERILPKILDRSFEQTSYVSTNMKDQELMAWMIDQAKTTLPLRDAACDSWLRAAEQGLAGADPTEAIKVLERAVGVEVAGDIRPEHDTVRPTGNAYEHLDDLTGALYLVAIFEAFALTAKLGMDAGAMFEVMRTASGASAQLERMGAFFAPPLPHGGIRERVMRAVRGFIGADWKVPPLGVYADLYDRILRWTYREGLRLPLHEASASALFRALAMLALSPGKSSYEDASWMPSDIEVFGEMLKLYWDKDESA